MIALRGTSDRLAPESVFDLAGIRSRARGAALGDVGQGGEQPAQSYDEPALRAMVRDLGAGHRWDYREVPFGPLARAVVFAGIPAR